jgi:hypothetical protein
MKAQGADTMSSNSLFKIQSLVAIILFTFLFGAGTDSMAANAGGTQVKPVEKPTDSSADDSGSDTSTAKDKKDEAIQNCMFDNSDKTESECRDRVERQAANLDSRRSNNACETTSDRAKTLSQNASTATENLFKLREQVADQDIAARQAALKTAATVTNAQADYNVQIANIQLILPIQIQSIQDAAAAELQKIKSKMIDLGNSIIAIEDGVQQAQTDYDTAVSTMLSTCTTFAGGKASKKLEAIDKAYADLLSRPNTYVNNSATNAAGAKNRRDTRRIIDSQAVRNAAFKACMSGQTDPNAGEPGPGPQLAQAMTDKNKAIGVAQAKLKKQMAIIDAQKALLLQEIALNDQKLGHQVQAATTQAQAQANQILTNLQKAITAANTESALAAVPAQVKGGKGGLWDLQWQSVSQQAQYANFQAQSANATAASACHDPGALTNTLQQQQYLQPASGSGAAQ